MRIRFSIPGSIDAIDRQASLSLFPGRVVAGLFFSLFLSETITAEEAKVPVPATPPPHRELWVPMENLEAVLKSRPRAVTLSREQYRTLIRDAVKGTAPKTPDEAPPVPAVIRDASFEGTLGNEVVQMSARYTVECFTDKWTEIPLSLPRSQLAHITVDEESALKITPPPKGKNPRPVLAVRGKGQHTIVAEYHLPVSRSPAGNAFQITSPGVSTASLKLTLPDGAKLDSSLPFLIDESRPDLAHFVLPSAAGENFEIRWTARTIAAIPDAAVFQTCQYLYSIDSTRIQADLGMVLNSSLADLPDRFSISLPDGVRVLSIEGTELLRWTRNDASGKLEVILTAGKRQAADLRILAEADVPAQSEAEEDIGLALPIAEIDGIHRASGTMALLGSEDVRVKNITTGALTVAAPDAIDPTIRNHPDFVTGFRFPVTTAAPEVTLSPVRERFTVQMDTRVELKREAIHLTRQLSIVPMEGRIFSTELTLPDGEELVDVAPAIEGELGFEWNRLEGNHVRLSWRDGLETGDAPSLTVTSRRDPEGWFALDETPMALNFSNSTLPGAESVSGYVAVAFDESFRVETITADGMEARDGRTTPITGPLAWFRLSDYALELNAARRPTEVEAKVTAYALPLQSTLEIEGQLELSIRYSPISEIVVSADPEIASQLRFDSPLLAEKRLNAETGEWTLAFHDEQLGFRRLRFRMALPFEMEQADDDSGQKRFSVNAPVLSVPKAKRLNGDWIMEANSDTELAFEANGLDAVDSLRVPFVDGYQPRHRVIAAYQYRGDAWELEIAGTRHAPEELVSTVVDSLRIDTVVSTGGDDRHQAQLHLRTSGEQFLEIALPKDAVVWTLTVDGAAVKPVRAEPGTLRVQLPAHESGANSVISLKLVYQTPGRKWGGSGKETLDPIRLADRIPVMRSQWLLHLPEGYDYQKFRGNLRQEFQIIDRTLLGQVWEERDEFLPNPLPQAYAYIGATEDAAMVVASAPSSRVDTNAEVYLREQMTLEAKSSGPVDPFGGPEPGEMRPVSGATFGFDSDPAQIGSIENKLKSIMIPSVEFLETPLHEAISFLEARSRELDPDGQGVRIIRDTTTGTGETPITLKLTNVPLVEALRYTAALANLKYRTDPGGVVMGPLSSPSEELVTREFVVPPNFFSAGAMGGGGGGGAADPFAAAPAEPSAPSSTALAARKSAKGVLESYGIIFPEGADASFDSQTGKLIVRNTKDQMDLVDAVQHSIQEGEIVQEKIPLLGGIPAVGRLFSGTSHRDSQSEISLEEMVDSENGERIVVWSDGTGHGGVRHSAIPLYVTGIGGAGIPGLGNDLLIDEFVCENLPLAEAVAKLESKARAAAASTQPNNAPENEGYPANRSLELALDADGETAQKPVSFSLKNLTLGQVLAKITEDTGTEYRTTASGVVIAQPSPIPADQLTTLVLELPNSAFETSDGNGGKRRQSARNVLTDAGVKFPAGTSAAYNFSTGRLAVRNTQENLEQVREMFAEFFPTDFDANDFANYGEPIFTNALQARLKGFDPRNAGLIPIDFALPESGRSYAFSGLYAPEPIKFRYVNWERQVRLAWVWILAGGLAFWFGAVRRWKRPVILGILGVITLTFTPLILSQSLLAFCNSLLIGWLVAMGLWLLWRICDRASQTTESVEAEPVISESAKPRFF